MLQDVDGTIDTNYEFDVVGECNLDAEDDTHKKFLLTRETQGVREVLVISDYVESESQYIPLQGEELEKYLMYYVDKYARENPTPNGKGKDFLKRVRAKINFKK